MTNSNYQFDNFYLNSRLSSVFTPVKDLNNKLIYQMNEGINTKMIMNGIQLNKIGTFDQSELGKYSLHKTALNPNAQSIESHQSINPKSPFRNFNLIGSNGNYLGTPQMLSNNSNGFYHSYMNNIPSYIENTVTNINNSIRAQQNKVTQIKPFDMALDENNRDIYGFMGEKKKKFVTKEIEERKNFSIEANKMTKKVLDENVIYNTSMNDQQQSLGVGGNPLNGNNRSSQTNSNVYTNININPLSNKTPKVTKNTRLSFQDNNTSSIVYQYLLEKFDIEPDESFDFNNLQLMNKYNDFAKQQHHDEIIFGENPLNKFNDWLAWLNQEQEKDPTEQSKQLCDDILKTLNSISGFMSSLPILVCPNQQRASSFDFLRKQSKKKKELCIDINNKEDQKLFCCELCFEPFKTGQGLGGHMSRKHKDQSIKFKRKKEIRTKREPIRNILLKAKKKLCKDNCVDFEEKMKTKQGKKYIKWLILENNEEYKRIRNDLKQSYSSRKYI